MIGFLDELASYACSKSKKTAENDRETRMRATISPDVLYKRRESAALWLQLSHIKERLLT